MAALLRSSACLLRAGTLQKQGGLASPASFLFSSHRRMFSNDKILIEMDSTTAPDDALWEKLVVRVTGVAVMTMKSPPVNSLSLDFLTEFAIGMEKLEMDKGCRGVIVTSALPKIFSAGLDITEMSGKSAEHYSEFWRAVQEFWIKLYGSNMVTIAAINGSSPAGGCLMAMACDYRIMADDPKYSIGLNETRLGIVAPFWFKDTMINTIGIRETEKALQLGLMYSPGDALKVGLVDQLVAEDKVHSAATTAMSQWLAVPDHARQLTKSMMRKPTRDRLLTHRETDITSFVNFITRDSIQKSLLVYMERLKQRKA